LWYLSAVQTRFQTYVDLVDKASPELIVALNTLDHTPNPSSDRQRANNENESTSGNNNSQRRNGNATSLRAVGLQSSIDSSSSSRMGFNTMLNDVTDVPAAEILPIQQTTTVTMYFLTVSKF
jgi:hypothetical protein